MRLTAAELAGRAGGVVVEGDGDAVCTSYGFDSRALGPHACFVAVRGHRDGHDFVDDAFHAGAVVALVSEHRPRAHPLASGRAVVQVDDTIGALARIARSVRLDHGDLQVVGVAGSTGKTSTKDLLAAALATSRRTHANPESFNNELGLPLTILSMEPVTEVLVTEMGERFPGDLTALCAIARPTVGVVTNVGLAHAEHLGGPEGVASAMAELLAALPPSGLAVLWADDPWTAWLRDRSGAPVVTVGLHPSADEVVTGVRVDAHLRPSFELAGTTIEVPIRGAHQVANAALAAVVALRLGVAPDVVAVALRAASSARWRLEIDASEHGVTVLNDSYNANPASMEAALRALAHLRVDGRRVAVLGDMRELGEHSDEAHDRIGWLARELAVDLVVGVGDGGARIARGADGPGVDVLTAGDAEEALALLRGRVARGDAVLVKASRALRLDAVAAGLLSGEPTGISPGGSVAR